jgi:hypothetical protein
MALTEFLILRKPRSGCLEERTTLIQLTPDSLHTLESGNPQGQTPAEPVLDPASATLPPG